MMEQVYVGNSRLVGEVIKISDQITTIQVYEETTGLRPGEPVYGTGAPMNILLGPGILDNIFDGIERPLQTAPLSRKAPPYRFWTIKRNGMSL